MMLRRTVGLVVMCIVAACGGSSNATAPTPQTPPPPPPVKQTITAGTYSATAHFSHLITFSTPATGQVSITVTWGNASDTLWVDLSASCTSDQYVAGTCQFVYSDRSSVPLAQKTATVNALAAGMYVLYIDNRGPSDETVTYEIDLTS